MYCKNCGKEIGDGTRFCSECGASMEVKDSVPLDCSRKSRTVVALLAFFLGYLGIHRFYVGKVGTGILQILLTCCFGIGVVWALIDFIIIVCGNFKDSEGKIVSSWEVKY